MDEWNPLLSPPVVPAPRRRSGRGYKLTGGILALACVLSLIGWLFTG